MSMLKPKWQCFFYTMSCEFKVHRAGSQIIIGIFFGQLPTSISRKQFWELEGVSGHISQRVNKAKFTIFSILDIYAYNFNSSDVLSGPRFSRVNPNHNPHLPSTKIVPSAPIVMISKIKATTENELIVDPSQPMIN